MANQQTLQGSWNEIQGKIRERWGQLTDDDLQNVKGNVDQLVGLIQRKTGEARRSIESYINELTSDGAGVANRAMESAREYTNQAASAVRHGYENVADEMRDRYSQAERMIHDRPATSAAVALGAGVCLGILVGLCLRSR
jgi:uncharacterized protein YjbJ (UPF0337 family)